MKKPPKMEVQYPTGSHRHALEQAARDAGTGLVIEHGAGMYSSPLLARLGCRVLCVESHEGWREWAEWIYQGRAGVVADIPSARLRDASLVFVDGVAEERGPLLSACMESRVPLILAHDTDQNTWNYYGFSSHHFMTTLYAVSHPAPRTTLWKLKQFGGVPFDV
jgi:hypothetical protein